MGIKKGFTKFLAVTVIAASILAVTVLARRGDQSPIPSVASTPTNATTRSMPEIKQPLPFGAGEVMKFEVKISRFPIYASVGEMTFTVSEEKAAPVKPAKDASEK